MLLLASTPREQYFLNAKMRDTKVPEEQCSPSNPRYFGLRDR